MTGSEEHEYCLTATDRLSPRDALAALEDGAVLLDIRSPLSLNGRFFEGGTVVAIPFAELESRIDEIPVDRRLIVADCAGTRSGYACRILSASGFDRLSALSGGMIEWERDGMPVAIDRNEELAGGCACKLRPGGRFRRRPGGC